MSFAEIDIEIPARQQGKAIRPGRSARLRIPKLSRPTLAAVAHARGEPAARIHHADGAFYGRVGRPEQPCDAADHLRAMFLPPYPSGRPTLSDADLADAEGRFAVLDGRLVQRIHEPVWLVETRDSGGRMNVRDNARQGVSMRLSCAFDRYDLQHFDPRPLPPTGSPCSVFRATRAADAERLVAPVAADTAWGQADPREGANRLEVLRPDLFLVDDRAMTLRIIGPMLVSLAHAICGSLTRAGIERWIDLRRLIAADAPCDEAGYARIQELAAGLLREARELRSEHRQTDVMFKRTRNCAAMLVHRLDADNRHEPEPEAAFGPAP